MKKNKITTIAVASVVSLSLLSGGIYAWFTSQKVSAAVEVETGKVSIGQLAALTADDNYVPGEEIVLTKNEQAKIINDGTRAVICEISFDFEEDVKGTIPGTPDPAHAADYNAGVMTKDRLEQVLSCEFVDADANGWFEIDGKYYARIEDGADMPVGDLVATILPELGGNASDNINPGLSDDRQYEHGTKFEIAYRARAVQATKGAAADYYSPTVADTLEAQGNMYDPAP